MLTKKYFIDIANVIIKRYNTIPKDDNHCLYTKYVDLLIMDFDYYFSKEKSNYDSSKFIDYIYDGITKEDK